MCKAQKQVLIEAFEPAELALDQAVNMAGLGVEPAHFVWRVKIQTAI